LFISSTLDEDDACASNQSWSAKADDPVRRGFPILSPASAITGCPLSRA
jgi:hypothetical protein